MENVLKILSDIRVIIFIAVIIVLLLVWFLIQRGKTGSYRRQLEALEVRYNSLKSEPLSFKLNKADAISRIDPEVREKIIQTKDDFEKAQANLKQIGQALADTEDEILVGKLKQAKQDLEDLEASVSLGEVQVGKLKSFLDGILEKETEQRERVNEQKARFRSLKEEAQNNSSQLSYIWPTIEQLTSENERMFSSYEEWSYANDFEKASAQLDEIDGALDRMDTMIHSLPELLSAARGVVPGMIEAVRNDSMAAKSRGVYLDHLHIENNLTLITGGLKDDLSRLKGGDTSDVAAHIQDYKQRLTQLGDEVRRETDSYDELKKLQEETDRSIQECTKDIEYIRDKYARISSRFGLTGMSERIAEQAKNLQDAIASRPDMEKKIDSMEIPASGLVVAVRELNARLSQCESDIRAMKTEIDGVSDDEDRAKKQLLKLQVIMNQMQVKIRKYKLPSISEQYEEDMVKADKYIASLENLLEENPLNIQELNSTLKEAIDFIYKLYNNVNNMVATVIMVENTIVFGNRYRSTYADIDSELTRSELSFRNGEYTQALTIAIATIEKIHPGNYENMIKENAKSAA
ncbi:MAG: selenide, water dikinase [Solobacterium sp.]|nr:selenide, water dikinase [Solobacterium sp.]MBQ6532230.1 selenide, water dikinase [Solobacterium sp.]